MRRPIIADRFANEDAETRSKIILGEEGRGRGGEGEGGCRPAEGEDGDRPRITQRQRSTSRRRGAN